MKRILVIVAILSITASATGVYQNEWTQGMHRYCEYTDGTVITVDFTDICPRYVN